MPATFVLGTALAALSGVLTAPPSTRVYGDMGEMITFKTFAITIVGGTSNVRGTLLVGWQLGIIESYMAGLVVFGSVTWARSWS